MQQELQQHLIKITRPVKKGFQDHGTNMFLRNSRSGEQTGKTVKNNLYLRKYLDKNTKLFKKINSDKIC
jgi:hypothetical protein